jgi:uncharacterized membrane protein
VTNLPESEPKLADRPGFKKERVFSLQDNIFAVAMTLLALDVRVPDELSHGQLREHFAELAVAIEVYGATFIIIGVVWLFVYSFEEIVPKLDIPGASLLLLACAFVVLLPFTSAAFASYPRERVTVFAFISDIVLIVATYTAYTEYATRRLIPTGVDRGFLRTVRRFLWLQLAVSAVAYVFWSEPQAIVLWLVAIFVAAYVVLLVLYTHFVRAAAVADRSIRAAD